jgi:hypothetical protein
MGSQTVAVKHGPGRLRRGGLLDKYFYFGMSLLIAAIVVYGFSHTVNQNLLHATPPRPWLLWMHGMLFSGWVAFFILQTALVRTHNVEIHRILGSFGAALGALIPLVGVSVAIVMARFDVSTLHQSQVDTAAFLLVPIWDMAAFTVCFWLAVYWRKKPEFHRRLMLVAMCLLTDAAWGRLPWLHLSYSTFYIPVDLLILLAVGRDLMVNRKVHVVYRYVLPVLIVAQCCVMYVRIHHVHAWVRIADVILRFKP